MTKGDAEKFVMTFRRAQVLEVLSKQKMVPLKNIVRAVGVQDQTVRHVLDRFVDMGLAVKKVVSEDAMFGLTDKGWRKAEEVLVFDREGRP